MEAHRPSRYIIGLLGFTPESGQVAQNSSNMPLQCPGPESEASLNLVPVLFRQKLSVASVIPPAKSRSNSPVLYFIVLSQLSSPLPEGILIRFSPDDIQGILKIVDGINPSVPIERCEFVRYFRHPVTTNNWTAQLTKNRGVPFIQ